MGRPNSLHLPYHDISQEEYIAPASTMECDKVNENGICTRRLRKVQECPFVHKPGVRPASKSKSKSPATTRVVEPKTSTGAHSATRSSKLNPEAASFSMDAAAVDTGFVTNTDGQDVIVPAMDSSKLGLEALDASVASASFSTNSGGQDVIIPTAHSIHLNSEAPSLSADASAASTDVSINTVSEILLWTRCYGFQIIRTLLLTIVSFPLQRMDPPSFRSPSLLSEMKNTKLTPVRHYVTIWTAMINALAF